jgi:hypothetical protein
VYVPPLKLPIVVDVLPLNQLIEYGDVPPLINKVILPSIYVEVVGLVPEHTTESGNIVTTESSKYIGIPQLLTGVGVGQG